MPESRVIIECPLCRCRMEVPRRGGLAQMTCRNGHRFVRDSRERQVQSRPRARVLLVALLGFVLMVVMIIAIALAAHVWPPVGPRMHFG